MTGACEACPSGSTNEAGDNPSGDETQCACAANYRVNSDGACVACPSGSTNEAGDVAPGTETQCVCNDGYSLLNGECVESTEVEVKVEFAGITQVIDDTLVQTLQNALTTSLLAGTTGVQVDPANITIKYTMLGKQTFSSLWMKARSSPPPRRRWVSPRLTLRTLRKARRAGVYSATS